MAGKPGRSGRRSLTDEAVRAAVRQLAWQRAGELLSDSAVKEHGLPKVVAIAGTPIVKADMAKPVVIDNSQHTHYTSINVDSLTEQEVIDLAMEKYNGRQDTRQPA